MHLKSLKTNHCPSITPIKPVFQIKVLNTFSHALFHGSKNTCDPLPTLYFQCFTEHISRQSWISINIINTFLFSHNIHSYYGYAEALIHCHVKIAYNENVEMFSIIQMNPKACILETPLQLQDKKYFCISYLNHNNQSVNVGHARQIELEVKVIYFVF